MPKATQLSLHLQNQPGVLARLCRDLASGGVNLLALSAPDDQGSAPIRLLVANRELAEHALRRAGYGFKVEEVLLLEMKNRPGALARMMEKLARARIDVRYAYATAYTKAQKTAAVVAVNAEDLTRAHKLLG